MGISTNNFNYYLKKLIKGIYLVVNISGIDVTADYQINKPSANTKSIIICVIKIDTVYLTSLHLFVSFFYKKKKKKRNYYKTSRVF